MPYLVIIEKFVGNIILNQPELIYLQTVEMFEALLSKTNYSL